jgi:hypothetical protein
LTEKIIQPRVAADFSPMLYPTFLPYQAAIDFVKELSPQAIAGFPDPREKRFEQVQQTTKAWGDLTHTDQPCDPRAWKKLFEARKKAAGIK